MSLIRLDNHSGAETCVVFSHPNHELAVYGLLQRLKPHLIYLTDGGGADRVAQTQAGLEAIGLADRAQFLDFTEQSFYDALVQVDAKFYLEVARRLRAKLPAAPSQVLCDGVEFYNPVHDLALPLTLSALRGVSQAPVFEIPLIHQSAVDPDVYRLQRAMDYREPGQSQVQLTPAELAAKLHARAKIYTLLHGQLGPLLADLKGEHLGHEVFVPADLSPAYSPRGCVLRYEYRARLLRERGKISNEIQHARNFVPILRALE